MNTQRLLLSLLALVGTMTVCGISFSFTNDVVAQTTPTSYNVTRIQAEPIFTSREDRIEHDQGKDMLSGMLSLIGTDNQRYFVVGGYCSMVRNNWGKGGLYAFTDSGEYVGKRDACFDATNGSPPALCKHDFGCHAYFEMIDIGDGAFVRELGNDFSETSGRPWITYEVSASGIDMVDRLFVARQGTTKPPQEEGDIVAANEIAYANNMLIDVEWYDEGIKTVTEPYYTGTGQIRQRYGTTNKLYAIPDIRELAEIRTDGPFSCPAAPQSCSGVPEVYAPKYRPVVGIGEYFLARELGPMNTELFVYRMPSRSEINSGNEPTLVQTLTIGRLGAYAVDNQDNTRIALVTTNDFKTGVLRIYKAGASGLTLERDLGSDTWFASYLSNPAFAAQRISLSGEYVAYERCTQTTGAPAHQSNCEMVVYKNGSRLSVEPLPLNEYGEKQRIQGIEISPSGNILVGTRNMLGGSASVCCGTPDYDQYLYLYKIGGATVQPPITPGPGNFNINLSEQDLLDLLALYLRVLGVAHGQIFGGNQTGNTGGATGGNTGSTSGNTGGNTGNTGSTGGTAGGSGDKDPLLDYGD